MPAQSDNSWPQKEPKETANWKKNLPNAVFGIMFMSIFKLFFIGGAIWVILEFLIGVWVCKQLFALLGRKISSPSTLKYTKAAILLSALAISVAAITFSSLLQKSERENHILNSQMNIENNILKKTQEPITRTAKNLILTQTFSTEGHPKSNGVIFTIKYPNEWKLLEGERPHVIQSIKNPSGDIAVTILTRDMGNEYTPTKEDLISIFSSDEYKKSFPAGSTFISSETTEIEGEPAGTIEYTTLLERVGVKLYSHVWQVNFIQNNVFVSISFSVSGFSGTEKDVEDTFLKGMPLFMLMVNSIVFPHKYK